MVKKIHIGHVSAIETGAIDLQMLWHNFTNIGIVINEHAVELNTLAYRQTQTISFGIGERGQTTILRGDKHHRIKIINAFVQMGDSIPEECVVEIEGMSNSVRFSKTESAGKVRIFDLHKNELMFYEDLVVNTTSNRRVIVSVTFESSEGGN